MYPAKTFQQALQQLRVFHQNCRMVIHSLGGRPDPLRLFNSVQALIKELLSQDFGFASDHNVCLRDSR
eukprot:3070932-Amphidinium_carterae.1